MARTFFLMTLIITGLFAYPKWQEAQAQEQILEATVQITMTVPQWTQGEQQDNEPLPIPPEEYRSMTRVKEYVVAEGLGTVVQDNGRSYLVTHDHWSQLAANTGSVQFRDAAGALLAEMDLYHFKRLILARDGGTMLLSAPDALQKPAKTEMNKRDTARDDLWLVHRQEGRLTASRVQKVAAKLKDGVAVWRLQGQVVESGDSGGGVWANGRLEAVTWTAVMLESPSNTERQATDMSIAAVYMPIPSAQP
ncbi:MAG: hypothetical protein R3293_22585 [Candidatus Promineifilaceae bacterium]|nr:hypothetical protein [Candidatus Promineifilaceae bacterium]